MANQEQEMILKEGAEFWIKWREENRSVEIDLLVFEKLICASIVIARRAFFPTKQSHRSNYPQN